MVRVLCLQGWATNTEILTYQMKNLREELKSEVEFDILQAPHEVPIQRDPVLLKRFKGKYYGWYSTKQVKSPTGASTLTVVGLEESVEVLKRHLSRNKAYDGIIGFSQGGSMAIHILSLQNRGELQSHFKFAILVSPGLPPSLTDMKFVPRSLSVLFSLGMVDQLMPVGLMLSRCFLAPRFIYHQEGHRFPRLSPEVVQTIREVMFPQVRAKL